LCGGSPATSTRDTVFPPDSVSYRENADGAAKAHFHARADALATPGEGTGPTERVLSTCRPGLLTRRRPGRNGRRFSSLVESQAHEDSCSNPRLFFASFAFFAVKNSVPHPCHPCHPWFTPPFPAFLQFPFDNSSSYARFTFAARTSRSACRWLMPSGSSVTYSARRRTNI